LRFPDQDFSIALVSNLAQVSSGYLANQIAEIYLEEALEKVATPGLLVHPFPLIHISEEVLSSYKGTYLSEESNFTFKLLENDGVLKMAFELQPPIPLSPLSGNQFRPTDAPDSFLVEIDTDRKQKVEAVYVTSRNSVRRLLKPVGPPRRSEEYLSPLTGRYFSSELDAFYDVTREGRLLSMEGRKQEKSSLQPVFLDGFNWEGGIVRFVRDSRGNPIGFRRNSGRITNLWFERLAD
jgi:hypothetical protein